MAIRKPAAKPLVTKPPPVTKRTAADRRKAVLRIVEDAAEEHGPGCVETSENTNSSYLLRRPTGIASLDIAMAGGWPAAAPSVLVGPDGAGKDYLLWRTMAEGQATYGDDFCAAVYFTEFKLDKQYMKDICGFQIAMSEPELEELDRARHEHGMPGLTPYQVDHYRRQIGTFAAIYGVSADHGFDQVFKFIKSNCCQIVAVNSIGFLQTEAKEEKDSYEEFAQQRNEAMLLSKALPQFAMYMNRPDEDGRPNETALILLNQVRAKDNANTGGSKRPQTERDKYKTAANAWALKHGKAIEIFVHNGGLIMDEAVKPPYPVGRKKQWEITKGKLGTHEGIRGEFDYIFHHGADVQSDLINTAVKLGIVQLSGSWLSYEGSKNFRTQGYPRALQVLREDETLAKEIRSRCFQEAQIVSRSI